MNEKNIWRFVFTGGNDAFFNMALDEAFLLSCRRRKSPPILRLYQWEPPGVSIGYFQKINQTVDVDKCQERNIGIVRRLTGGRAVLHLNDLTYSVCASIDFFDYLGENVNQTYQRISYAFLEAFKLLKINAKWAKVSKPFSQNTWDTEAKNEEILAQPCFSSSSRYEIEICGKKILGSAQRRFSARDEFPFSGQESFLQHGALPLKRGEIELVDLLPSSKSLDKEAKSKFRKSYITLQEATNRNVPIKELFNVIQSGFESFFSIKFEYTGLTSEEEKLAQKLFHEKYETKDWNFRR
jgi:lipoyl(octanoyl) transferase